MLPRVIRGHPYGLSHGAFATIALSHYPYGVLNPAVTAKTRNASLSTRTLVPMEHTLSDTIITCPHFGLDIVQNTVATCDNACHNVIDVETA